jgi:hypothetical protein
VEGDVGSSARSWARSMMETMEVRAFISRFPYSCGSSIPRTLWWSAALVVRQLQCNGGRGMHHETKANSLLESTGGSGVVVIVAAASTSYREMVVRRRLGRNGDGRLMIYFFLQIYTPSSDKRVTGVGVLLLW